jgi:hypothetical protein
MGMKYIQGVQRASDTETKAQIQQKDQNTEIQLQNVQRGKDRIE